MNKRETKSLMRWVRRRPRGRGHATSGASVSGSTRWARASGSGRARWARLSIRPGEQDSASVSERKTLDSDSFDNQCPNHKKMTQNRQKTKIVNRKSSKTTVKPVKNDPKNTLFERRTPENIDENEFQPQKAQRHPRFHKKRHKLIYELCENYSGWMPVLLCAGHMLSWNLGAPALRNNRYGSSMLDSPEKTGLPKVESTAQTMKPPVLFNTFGCELSPPLETGLPKVAAFAGRVMGGDGTVPFFRPSQTFGSRNFEGGFRGMSFAWRVRAQRGQTRLRLSRHACRGMGR